MGCVNHCAAYDREMRRKRGRPPHVDILTKTEWNVVQHGMTSRQIAARRGASFDAVKFHFDNAMKRLGVPDRKTLRRRFHVSMGSALSMPTQTDDLPLGIGQISRSVPDIHASECRYRDVLRLPQLFTAGNLALFD